MLAHCYAEGEDIEMQLEVAYAEADQTAEITLTCTGAEYENCTTSLIRISAA